ncbi:MAG: beta-ketoacyl synthase chain length factor [Flavobacteriales bacterium]|nr:beta-ketoacyl synthase chain length factor [Flavobacteriales bacterium]
MYIIDCYSISPQKTFDESFFEGQVEGFVGNKYHAIEPSYADLIPRGLLRRMGKAVRIGIGAGLPLIEKQKDIDGIIIGTATGGLDDCIKFLNQIVEYDEGTLTPTNFVQSTPNAIGGHLAMMSKNTGYNNTHMGIGTAFESTLLDAFLLFEEGEASKLLIGNVEETSQHHYNIDAYAGYFKTEEISSTELFNSNSKGSICGEGAAMFVVSNKKENALCKLVDVHQFTYPKSENIEERVSQFLEKNNMSLQDIDSLVLGFSGDNRYDFWYTNLMNSFPKSTVYSYKNLVGEYPTSSGFATWLATKILTGKKTPNKAIYKDANRTPKNILIYNNYLGAQHGFILLKST